MLVQKSTFFKDVEDIVYTGSHDSSDVPPIRDLPSATPAALSLLLLVVEADCLKYSVLKLERQQSLRNTLDLMSRTTDYGLLDSLLSTADAYGFESLPSDLASQPVTDAWMDATVDLVARRNPSSLSSADSSRQEVWKTIPDGARDLLDRIVPDWHQTVDPLRRPHLAWYAVLDEVDSESRNPTDDFAAKCRVSECPSFRRHGGKWSSVIGHCGPIVKDAMWRAPCSTESHRHMSGAVFGTVACKTCAVRIRDRFGSFITQASDLKQVVPSYHNRRPRWSRPSPSYDSYDEDDSEYAWSDYASP